MVVPDHSPACTGVQAHSLQRDGLGWVRDFPRALVSPLWREPGYSQCVPGIPRGVPCTAIRCPNGVCYLAGEAALNEYLRIKTVTFEY